jgi:rhodanese-related sulfurtransferase
MKRVLLPAVLIVLASLTGCRYGEHDHPDYTAVVQTVDASQIGEWNAEGRSFRILDVRTQSEFDHDGHAPGAELVTWSYDDQVEGINEAFMQTVPERFDADETIVILCSGGKRSSQAADALQRNAGFSRVYVFAGGYEGLDTEGFPSGPGWRASGLPMESDAPAEDE